MNNITKICTNLLELIEEKDRIIVKQNKIISSVVNENLEKENMINALLQEQQDMY